MATTSDRVRAHTDDEVLRRIDDTTCNDLLDQVDAPAESIERRLDQLDREWDVDRVVEAKAALTGLTGLALAASGRRSSLRLPLLAASGLLLFASRGRNLFQPLYRRAGIRSAREIENERHALLALSGRGRPRKQPEGRQRPGSPAHATDTDAEAPVHSS